MKVGKVQVTGLRALLVIGLFLALMGVTEFLATKYFFFDVFDFLVRAGKDKARDVLMLIFLGEGAVGIILAVVVLLTMPTKKKTTISEKTAETPPHEQK